MPAWINFKELRSKLRFEDVLRHYEITGKKRGDRLTAFCPLPTHPPRNDNTPRTASLSVNLTRNIFQCFGCKASGNSLDFACRMEGFDPADAEQFRKGALAVAEVFDLAGELVGKGAPAPITGRNGRLPSRPAAPLPKVGSRAVTPIINAPLNFELKNLDAEHPYLRDREFLPETIQHFGLGYCNRGLMRGRVVIPLHNPDGQLVGYAGRLTKDEEICEEHPKYRFPGDRDVEGIRHEFRKSLLLYNAHRIVTPVDHLFVVEGFPALWWLWQANYRNTGALMGSSCSDEQGELIVSLVKPDGKVWLMPDGNEAGVQCAHSLFERVAPYRCVRWVQLGENEQPTDFQADELASLFQP